MKRVSPKNRSELLRALRRDGADLRAVARARGAREEMLAQWLLGPDAAGEALQHCAAQVLLAQMHLSEHRLAAVNCLGQMVRDEELRRAHPEIVRRAAVDLITADMLGLASPEHRALAAEVDEEAIDPSLRKMLYQAVEVEGETVDRLIGESVDR